MKSPIDRYIERNESWLLPLTLFIGIMFISFFTSSISDVNSPWFNELIKPALYPGSSLFGPVWTVLYALIALAFSITWRAGRGDDKKREVSTLFVINIILNLLWTPIFFGLHNPLLAYPVIILVWGTTALLVVRLKRVSVIAQVLLIPYLVWVTFATYLNHAIISLN